MRMRLTTLSLGVLLTLSGCFAVGSSPKLVPSATALHKLAKASGEVLYVGNAPQGAPVTITAYAAGSTSVLRTISSPRGASRLAFDPSGNLYVGLECSVAVYAPGATKPYRRIRTGVANPEALAVDGTGTLYVANAGVPCGVPGSITEYAPGASTPALTIPVAGGNRTHYLGAIALDSHDDAYVVSLRSGRRGFVTEYSPQSATIGETIRDTRSQAPLWIATDTSNNLYAGFNPSNVIKRYSPGATAPQVTIKLSAHLLGFVVDADGVLYVLERMGAAGTPSFIAVFKPGVAKPSRTITDGLKSPSILAVDNADNLYVANLGSPSAYGYKNPSVVQYAKGGSKPIRTITNGIVAPVALALSSE